ncbi:MAG TPA: alpha/beta fold hydrolase [Steroidobacteraceae bacterium]|nr:alpha/beta fold hydrolase [Steroidobacteraceae bacterium]
MIPRPLLAWATLCIACLAPGTASTATPAAGVSFGALEFTPCTLAAPGQAATLAARCATLEVPEDRLRPHGRRIELAIAWVPSSAKSPAPDPVLFLAGGPGQAALESFPIVAPAFREALRQRHVVLVDQRGTGRSHRLDCPRAIGDEPTATLDVTDPAVAREMARRCLDEIVDADPRFYTTNDYVADLEAVRGALGVQSVNLVGVSYGTRVALEYMRRHPERIRAALLDSVVPPTLILGSEHARNLDAAVDAQFARCEADARCRERFGSPRDRLDALLARLRREPVTVVYADPVTNERREDELDPDVLAGVVRLHAYSPPLFAMLPMLLEAATQGRYETLMAQARMVGQLVGEQISVPLQLAVSCAEDAPWLVPDPADRDTLMGGSFVELLRAQCEVWPRGRVPADFHDPVTAARPTLLLSGEFDPVTPARYGEAVAKQLLHARQLVLRGQGHGVLGVGCTPRLLGRFLERPEPARLDAGCIDALGYVPPFAGAYGWDP